jgi:hypothetical protein
VSDDTRPQLGALILSMWQIPALRSGASSMILLVNVLNEYDPDRIRQAYRTRISLVDPIGFCPTPAEYLPECPPIPFISTL